MLKGAKITLIFISLLTYILVVLSIVLYFFPFDASAMQVLIDLILLPTVVFGFWYATNEFRNSQARPSLSLNWNNADENKSITLEIPRQERKIHRLRLYVTNHGNLLATWFMIEIEAPTFGDRRDINFYWHLGDEHNQKTEYGIQDVAITTVKYRFSSNGVFALYPGESKHIGTLEIAIYSPHISGKTYHNNEIIRYSIVTDRTLLIESIISVNFEEEDVLKKIPSEFILEDLLLRGVVLPKHPFSNSDLSSQIKPEKNSDKD